MRIMKSFNALSYSYDDAYSPIVQLVLKKIELDKYDSLINKVIDVKYPSDINSIIRLVLQKESIVKLSPLVEQQPLPNNELEALTRWPVRAKADLSIRRCRYADIKTFLDKLVTQKQYKQYSILNSLSSSKLDYITICNIILMSIFSGIEWFITWNSFGVFSGDITHFSNLTSKVSDAIKVSGCKDANNKIYIENKCLTGYRQLPYPGFDFQKESAELAHSGSEHYWSEDKLSFKKLVHHLLYKLPSKWNEKMSLLQYIKSLIWVRSGASSLGHMEVSYDNNIFKIKARKNMLADLYTADQLYQLCISTRSQINYSFVKPELGKLRIAVSSDLLTYIKMSWIYYLASNFYINWQGVTSAETINVETNRMRAILANLKVDWAMPFDYASFDHQPTTFELMTIDEIGHSIARLNTTDTIEFDLISGNIMEGWRTATLVASNGNDRQEYKITGGLMSGLYVTAIIGNGWNKIVMSIAIRTSTSLFTTSTKILYCLKGDDSLLMAKDKITLQTLEYILRLMNVKGGVGKFGILHKNGEYLRTWFKESYTFGYAARTLPGIMQSKPWSDNGGWLPHGTMKAVSDIITILNRRIGSPLLDKFRIHVLHRWCVIHKLPTLAFNIPIRLGGFGILPWDGVTYIEPRIPTEVNLYNKLIPTIKTNWRQLSITNRASEFNIKLTPEQSKEIAVKQTLSLILADDIREVRRSARTEWENLVAIQKYKLRTLPLKYTVQTLLNYKYYTTTIEDRYDSLLQYSLFNERSTSFGKYEYQVSIIDEFRNVLKIAGISIQKFIEMNEKLAPIKYILKAFNKAHVAEKLDWLGGRVSFIDRILPTKLTSPFHTNFMINFNHMTKRSYALDRYASFVWPLHEITYYSQPFVFKYYNW